jgi:hypothetical protein
MLLEEDVVMKRNEEIDLQSQPMRDRAPPLPDRQPDDDRHACDQTPLWPISPPPMPWPRVFPGL